MNREIKRMMKRSGSADRSARPVPIKRKRTKPLEFLKEVRGELGRVSWPNRSEVLTYTLVVLVSVSFFMLIISAMDFLFTKGVIKLISRGGG